MNVGAAVLVGALVLGAASACVHDGLSEQTSSRAEDPRGPVYPAGWGFFSGSVGTPDGVALAEVRLDPQGRETLLILRNRLDGTFKIAVPSGHQVLVLSKPGYQPVRVEAEISPSEVHAVEVVMHPA